MVDSDMNTELVDLAKLNGKALGAIFRQIEAGTLNFSIIMGGDDDGLSGGQIDRRFAILAWVVQCSGGLKYVRDLLPGLIEMSTAEIIATLNPFLEEYGVFVYGGVAYDILPETNNNR
jgi:hypothetical protein